MALLDIPIPFEPLKKNRFIFRFPSSMGINEWYVESAQRPKASINPVEIPYLNTVTYVGGIVKPEAMTITFREPIGPSATQALQEWFRLHFEMLTGRMGYAVGYKKNIEIDLLDPTDVVVQKFVLFNTMITNIDYGDLSYSDDSLVNTVLQIQPDRWELIF